MGEDGEECARQLMVEAAQQLITMQKQLEAAIEDLRLWGNCNVCTHEYNESACHNCYVEQNGNCFEWRGALRGSMNKHRVFNIAVTFICFALILILIAMATSGGCIR